MKLRTILVPMDFSEESESAFEVAALIARRSHAELLLLHVIDMPLTYMFSGGQHISMVDRATEEVQFAHTYLPKIVVQAKEKLQVFVNRYPELRIRKQIIFDEFAKDAADFITAERADLIILGSHASEGSVEDVRLSQIEEKVIHQAKVPVFTVKKRQLNLDFNNVVFASNFKNISSKTVDHLKTIQQLLGATVHFLKVIPPKSDVEWQKENLDIISAFATRHGFLNYTANIYAGENKEVAIRQFAESVQADLIAMTNSDRNGLAHFLFGNLTEKVAKKSARSVLTLSQ
jgi:nucleotide-binding universal stress UspA family protein